MAMEKKEYRRYWRTWSHFTQADTYIEHRFEYMCRSLSNGEKIVNEWRINKKRYTEFTKQSLIDFQHYSRHDSTHSIAILEAIEMLIGKERIEKLEAGDLWLLLEAAYYHDIGMALTYQELICLWETDEEFKKFLKDSLEKLDDDQREASLYYKQIDNLIHMKEQMSEINEGEKISFRDSWPIKLNRYIMIIVAEYIRKEHAKRTKEFASKREETCHDKRSYGEPIIESRFYRLVEIISELHACDFSDIQKRLEYNPKGFGTAPLHPQFAAAMLRIGDLLDLDNNRFSIRSVEHFGTMPIESMLHMEKHASMTHLAISESEIQLEARSKDIRVCGKINEWFQAIEEEVGNLIYSWNEIAPPELIGCRLKKCKSKIYYKDSLFEVKNQKTFEVNKMKLIELMIGENIYKSKLDFLREYIQNALDATKMHLWLELKEGNYDSYFDWDREKELSPFEIPIEIFERFPIQINVFVDWHCEEEDDEIQFLCKKEREKESKRSCKPKVRLEIIDYGIGIDEECIQTLSKVGLGWRGRKKYSDEIHYLKDHLRCLYPTGGFGIGVQSAFMITDQVRIDTKAVDELSGHMIILTSPRSGGVILEEKKMIKNSGTKIIVEIDINEIINHDFFKEIKNQNNLLFDLKFVYQKGRDVFNKDVVAENICCLIEYYIKQKVPNSFFPIHIRNKSNKESEKHIVYESSFLPSKEEARKKNFIQTIAVDSIVYQYSYIKDKYKLLIWDSKNGILACIDFNRKFDSELGSKTSYEEMQRIEDRRRDRNPVCFRNVRIETERLDQVYINQFSVCIDFLGFSAEDVLKIHRDSLREEFQVEEYYKNFIKVFCNIVIQNNYYDDIMNKMSLTYFFVLVSNWIEEEKLSIIIKELIEEKQEKQEEDNSKKEEQITEKIDSVEKEKQGETENQKETIKYNEYGKKLENEPIKVLKIKKENEVWSSELAYISGLELIKRLLKHKQDNKMILLAAISSSEKFNDVIDLSDVEKIDENLKNYYTKLLSDYLTDGTGICIVDKEIIDCLEKFANKKSIREVELKFAKEKYLVKIVFYKNIRNLQQNNIKFSVFLKNMYEKVNTACPRVIVSNCSIREYETILVERLPFDVEQQREKEEEEQRYYISPIDSYAKNQIESERGSMTVTIGEKKFVTEREKNITLDRFKEVVMSEQSGFEFVVTWVTNHQLNKPRKTRQEIRKVYEGLIKDIYEECFEKE